MSNPSLPQGLASTQSPIFSSLPTGTAPRVVYVLENDHISSVITELIVKKNLSGGEVRCYPNGQAAFQDLAAAVQLNTGVPELILLDLDMPLMDGWEFLEALEGLPMAHGVCVFVLTSSIHPDDSARATSYRAVNGFFTKPLDEDSIVRIQVLLQEGHAQAEPAVPAYITSAPEAVNRPYPALPGAATAAQP